MSTPSTFYPALSGRDVSGGFLNRLLIVDSPIGRQKSRLGISRVEPPKKAIEWAKQNAFRATDDDDTVELRMMTEPRFVADPVLVPFSEACHSMLFDMEDEQHRLMNEFDIYGVGDLFGRTREIAMRVALIVAVSDGSDEIEIEHLEWARDYVFFYHRKMADVLRNTIGKGALEDVADIAAAYLAKCGREGATHRELVMDCRSYRSLHSRDREEVLYRLKTDYGVRFDEVRNEDGTPRRGAKRKAYVLPRRTG